METTRYKKIPAQVADGAHRVFLAGLGAFSLAEEETGKLLGQLKKGGKKLETEGRKQFDDLVRRGQKLENEGKDRMKKVRDDAGSAVESWQDEIDARVTEAVKRLGIPAREEIHTLVRRVEELTRKVEAVGAEDSIRRKVYHLSPADEGWTIGLEDVEEPISTHETKDAALAAGRDLAQQAEPSQLVVHRKDGTIQTAYSYGDEEDEA